MNDHSNPWYSLQSGNKAPKGVNVIALTGIQPILTLVWEEGRKREWEMREVRYRKREKYIAKEWKIWKEKEREKEREKIRGKEREKEREKERKREKREKERVREREMMVKNELRKKRNYMWGGIVEGV